MANKIFQDILKGDIQNLINESASINTINHQGLKGDIREYGLGKILEKYLPKDFAIGSGQIHDFEGTQSNETDLLIYNKHILPPIMFGESIGLYPLESCYYSIEAKTTSTAQEIQTTIEKFNTLKKLKSLNQSRPITVYVALSTDLTSITELERYKKYDPDFYSSPAINVITIIGKGYWYYQNQKLADGSWYGYWNFARTEDNYELGYLVSGIINTLNGTKNNPSFGNYLLPDGHLEIVDQAQINITT